MPELSLIVPLVLAAAVTVAAVWRPEATVMGLGVFLFAQSAVMRVDSIPDVVRMTASRFDEITLLALALRFAVPQLLARRWTIPGSLWALGLFALIGVVSAFVNGVPIAPASVGLYLAVKGGLWLYVGLNLRYQRRVLLRYVSLIGTLFFAVIGLAILQFAGVTLPWDPHIRRSGELAATSIWNQHTVFGSAVAVAAGLSVLMLRLPGWRMYGAALAIGALVGIILSTVRRLLVSIPLAAVAVVTTLPPAERRRHLHDASHLARRPLVIGVLAAVLVVAGFAIGPRMSRVVIDTWDEYVVHAEDRDRYSLYRGGWELAMESPLVGRGPGTYGSFASVLFDSPAYAEVDVSLPDGLKMGAPYASLLGEFGILGLGLYVAFLILVARHLVRIARDRHATVSRAMASAGVFLIVNMAVESVVHVTFSDSFVAFFAFSCIGAASALSTSEGIEVSVAPPPERRWFLGSLGLAGLLIVFLVGTVAALDRRTDLAEDPRPNVAIVFLSELAPETLAEFNERSSRLGISSGMVIGQLAASGTTFVGAQSIGTSYSAALTSLLTGQLPSDHGVVGGSPADSGDEYAGRGLEGNLLPDWLAEAGYRTAFVGRYLDGYGAWKDPIVERDGHAPRGWEHWQALWGSPSYYHYRLNENGRIWGRGEGPEDYHTTDMITDIARIHRLDDGRPMLLIAAPLAPTAAPISHSDPRPGPVPAPNDDGSLTTSAGPATPGVEALLEIGRLIEAIHAEADPDRPTYVILTAATGTTPFGGQSAGTQVPFIIVGPGFTPGIVDPRPVDLTDVTATVLQLAELDAALPPAGRSLLPISAQSAPD